MARHILPLLLLLSLALAFVGQSDAFLGFGSKSSSAIIDSNPDAQIGIEQICGTTKHGPSGQITRVSTIKWLKANLASLSQSASESQVRCLYHYMEPVAKLNEIILTGSEHDACSASHISLVEDFHRVFIEHLLISYKGSGLNQKVIPEPLKWFFIHYAAELSLVCKQNFAHNLDLMGQNSDAEYGSILSGVSSKFVETIQSLIGSPETIKRDEDFVLIWNMLDRLNRKMGTTETDAPRATDGESTGVKLRLKMRAPGAMKLIQENCRNQLKPIYHETALSSMRLIDMGYNVQVEAASEPLTIDRQFQNWYSIAQACEYLLPIKIYQDPTLEPEELVVITEEEEEHMLKFVEGRKTSQESDKPAKSFLKRPALYVSKDNFRLRTANPEENLNKLFAQVKSNLRSRVKGFKRAMVASLKKLGGKAQLRKLYLSRKSKDGNKYVKTSSEPWAEDILEEDKSVDYSYDGYEFDQSPKPPKTLQETFDSNFVKAFVIPALIFFGGLIIIALITTG